MDTVFAGLVAVLGTLVGSVSTHLFQRRTARRAETAARTERLRQERLAAYSEFAAAANELKRGLITAWFRRRDEPRDEAAHRAAQTEADRLGALAETARFRLHLVADDPGVNRLAATVLGATAGLHRAADRQQIIRLEREFEAAVDAFLAAAARQVR
ncbi:hypothetical protein [Kitasatospora sp. DSM 101779]|uniref:hypothetical protein n=1 Tax=Kitasatospora sp. DSM 101779 TaxID=2853165 RepID=UPI0021D81C8B|nr:hypothetical protein [Kitasatospora sp. DSM 101779]MCU7826602.1 hypothetical protein [Kitasatospora sp. DSM 101779]